MKIILVLYCVLFVLPAWAHIDAVAERRLCHEMSGSVEMWVPVANRQVRVYAEEFLQKGEIVVTHILICESGHIGADIAWSRLIEQGRDRVFILGLSQYFVASMKKHLRTVVAHEVGHNLVRHKGGACDLFEQKQTSGDYVRCEHDADWVAMNWVGRSAVSDLLHSLLWYRDMLRAPASHGVHIEQRIRLIEHAP